MRDLKWSASEKKIARGAYEDALESMLAKLVTEFKAKAAAATTPSDMWRLKTTCAKSAGSSTRYSTIATPCSP
jgi:hypothetical protein